MTLSILSLPVERESPEYFPQAAELGSSLRALAFSTAPRRAETAQTNTFAERPVSDGPCLQAQPHACNAFNAAPSGQFQSAQTGPQDHWAKLGRSNASKAIKESNQHNHTEHGNLWLHAIWPIGISMTHIPPSARWQNTSSKG